MKRRRVTVSPSKAPGISRSAVYFGLALLAAGGQSGSGEVNRAEDYRPGRADGGTADRGRRPRRRRARARRRRAAGLRVGVGRARPPADRPRAGVPQRLGELGVAAAWACAHSEITSASSAHRREVAERGEPREAERVEAVAGQQREVGVGARSSRGVAVVQQVALVDRLDEQLVLRRAAAARGPAAAIAAARGRRGGDLVADPRAPRRAGRPRRASAAASRASALTAPPVELGEGRRAPPRACSSMCSGVWASDGNQASNCDGGG